MKKWEITITRKINHEIQLGENTYTELRYIYTDKSFDIGSQMDAIYAASEDFRDQFYPDIIESIKVREIK